MIDYNKTLILTDAGTHIIRLMTSADLDESIQVLTDTFQREPMTQHLNITPAQFYSFALENCKAAIASGLGIVAENKVNGSIEGLTILQDIMTEEPELEDETLEAMAPIFAVLDSLMLKYIDEKQLFIEGEVVISVVTGVKKEAAGSIATKLFRCSIEHAKNRGFNKMIGEFTGRISQTVARIKFDFVKHSEIHYATFLFDGKPVFADIEDQKLSCHLLEREL